MSGYYKKMVMVYRNRVLAVSAALSLMLFASAVTMAGAKNAETVLLVPESGAEILARNPETHVVLARQSKPPEDTKLVVEASGRVIEPSLIMEGDQRHYLHFLVPLRPGQNAFLLVPDAVGFSLQYTEIKSDIIPKTAAEGLYRFHRDGGLPDSCGECHALNVAESAGLAGIVSQESCADCHRNLVTGKKWKHSTTVNSQCLVCHAQPDRPEVIGLPVVNTQELCLSCHAGSREWFSAQSIHGVISLGGCTLCHDPHAGAYRYQLWEDGSLGLCLMCHGDKKDLVVGQGKVPYVHGIIFGKGCIACHDPHASSQQFMLYEPINPLCLGCHPRQQEFRQGHPVPGHPVAASEELLREGRQLTCSSCHEPHGTDHPSMLIETTRGMRICQECHDR